MTFGDFYHVNALFAEASEPNENGNVSYGPVGVAWNGRAAQCTVKKTVQINKYQGHVHGLDSTTNGKDVDTICRFDHPLPELKQSPASETDKKIASYMYLILQTNRFYKLAWAVLLMSYPTHWKTGNI